jgi:hypothetical protein
MFTREDNKAMTINTLLQILKDNRSKLDFDKPLIMSSDEEGNEMLSLYGVEINKKQITLYPAHL